MKSYRRQCDVISTPCARWVSHWAGSQEADFKVHVVRYSQPVLICPSPEANFIVVRNEAYYNKASSASERTLNPIALRMVKSLWSFSCSECNRVTRHLMILVTSFSLYKIAAFVLNKGH